MVRPYIGTLDSTTLAKIGRLDGTAVTNTGPLDGGALAKIGSFDRAALAKAGPLEGAALSKERFGMPPEPLEATRLATIYIPSANSRISVEFYIG
jgi:hypothetical protein